MKIKGKTAIYELYNTVEGFLTIKKINIKTGMLEDNVIVNISELDKIIPQD